MRAEKAPVSKESRNILLCLFFLAGLGLVQVYSSSFLFAEERYGNGLFFFRKQLLFSLLSFAVFFVVARIPWKYNRHIGMILWFVSVLALVLTLFPGLSAKAGGAQRWLALPFGLRFQPAELLKITSPFLLAWMLILKEKWPLQEVFFWLIPVCALSLPLTILMLQPDFGTVVLLSFLLFAFLFLLGMRLLYFGLMAVSVAALMLFIVRTELYRSARLSAFFHLWEDPLGKGFQIIQSLLGVHSGALFGSGLGKGQIKLFFLPEAHTDFSFAVLAEETGFIGVMLVLSLYGFLIYSGWSVSLKVHDFYEKILSFCLVFVFALSVFVHCAVNLALLPAKGLALPFLSYGGSSLLCVFLLFAWLISLDRDKPKIDV